MNHSTNIAKYLLIFFALLLLSMSLNAQPIWSEQSYRDNKYPSHSFYSAYIDDAYNKENPNVLIESLKQRLSLQIASEIKVQVQAMQSQYISQTNATLQKQMSQSISSFTDVELVGIRYLTHVEKESKQIYVLAYLNRFEMLAYYKAEVNILLKQVDKHISAAEGYQNMGEPSKAISEYENALPLFDDITEKISLLLLLQGNDEDDYINTCNALETKIKHALEKASQSATIFLESSLSLFDEKAPAIDSAIKAQLANAGYRFVSNKKEALWHIKIKASARQFNQAQGFFFSYVDAQVSVVNTMQNKEIYGNNISTKGGHTISYSEAARKAYRELSKKTINNLINNLK